MSPSEDYIRLSHLEDINSHSCLSCTDIHSHTYFPTDIHSHSHFFLQILILISTFFHRYSFSFLPFLQIFTLIPTFSTDIPLSSLPFLRILILILTFSTDILTLIFSTDNHSHSYLFYRHSLAFPPFLNFFPFSPPHARLCPEVVQESSGLMVRKVPEMSLTQTISSSPEALPALTYNNECVSGD